MTAKLSNPAPRTLNPIAVPIRPTKDWSGACFNSLTGLSPNVAYVAIGDGELKPIKVGKRTLLLVADIRAWLEGRRGGALTPPQAALAARKRAASAR